jgi:hypothetical protein
MKTKLLVLAVAISAVGFACKSAQVAPAKIGLADVAAKRTPANLSTYDCMMDAISDGCWFGTDDQLNVLSYANQCRTIYSKNGNTKTIIFRMTASGDLVFVKTRGQGIKLGGLSCPVTRVTTGEGGVSDLAARDNKVFFNTSNGHIYYGTVENQFFEILSNKGNETDAQELTEGFNSNSGKKTVSMTMANGQSVELDEEFLSKRRKENHVVGVKADFVEKFQSTQDGRSPFTKY